MVLLELIGLVGVALRLDDFFASSFVDFELEEEVLLVLGVASLITSLALLDDSFFLIGSPNKFLKVSGFLAFSFVLSEVDFEGVVVVLSL